MAFRQLPAPARLLGDEIDDAAQPPSIDRINVRILAIVPEILGRIADVDDAGGPDQFEDERSLVLAGGCRKLGGEGLDRERVRNV